MKITTKVFSIIIILLLTVGLKISYAASNYIPHVYLSGYPGSDSKLGQGEIIAPMFLINDRNLFVYGAGRYGDADEYWAEDPWTGSFGLGYRQIANNSAVLGVYVLGDYTPIL